MPLRNVPVRRLFPWNGSPNAATFDWPTKFRNSLREQPVWSSETKLPTDRLARAEKISDWCPIRHRRIRSVDDWRWLSVFRGECRAPFWRPRVSDGNFEGPSNPWDGLSRWLGPQLVSRLVHLEKDNFVLKLRKNYALVYFGIPNNFCQSLVTFRTSHLASNVENNNLYLVGGLGT